METQSEAIARIALSLPELPTAIDVLAALNKAYGVGFAHGAVSGANHLSRSIDSLMGPGPDGGFGRFSRG